MGWWVNRAALHAKVNGNTDKLFAFFRDLLPEEGRANFSKAVFCHMILKQPPTVETVRLNDLLRAMHQVLISQLLPL